MVERIEGKGKLVSRESSAEWLVTYDFEITTKIVKTPHGSVATKKSP